MKKLYSLKDLQLIQESKYYLSTERFVFFLTNKYGFSPSDAFNAFKAYEQLPSNYNISDPEKLNYANRILNIVLDLYKNIQGNAGKQVGNYKWDAPKQLKKIIYIEARQQKETVINFNDTDDILAFAEILKRQVVVMAQLSLNCEIDATDKKRVQIFEGDFFNTYDKYWGQKSNVYIATEEPLVFKRLIYIKGKGYLDVNGEPNYDEGKFNSYALTLDVWRKMGNIYTDKHLLADLEETPVK